MLSWEYIQFLNEKVLEYLPVDRVRIGNKVNFRCPICGDSHKSATKKRGFYYLDTASFYCFNCSQGMSGIRFLQILSGQAYEDIKKDYLKLFAKSGQSSQLSSFFEKPEEEPSLFDLKRMVKPEWKSPLSDAAREYLKNRMVLNAPFLKEDLYSFSGKNGEYILIPWVANGVEAYYQLNDFQKLGQLKYIFPKNSKKLVYGLDNVDISWPYIIVFEGVYDSLFVKNSVAVGTKSITEYQKKLIRERYPNHRLCVSFDNDSSGIESMQKLIEKNEDIRFLRWFNKNTKQKDVNDYVKALGDPNIFADPKKLEKLLVSPLQMKLWLAQNGMWLDKKQKRRYEKPAVQKNSGLKALAARLAI